MKVAAERAPIVKKFTSSITNRERATNTFNGRNFRPRTLSTGTGNSPRPLSATPFWLSVFHCVEWK